MTRIPNYGIVIINGLSRSAQPNAEQFAALYKRGVTHVLKLTSDKEYSNSQEAKEFKGKVLNYPMPGECWPEDYEIGEVVAEKISHLILRGKYCHVHCHRGMDRAGLVAGIYRLRYEGIGIKQVMKDWQTYGQPFHPFQEYLIKIAKELK